LTEALAEPAKFEPLRRAGRQTIVEGYDLKSQCLPRMIGFIEDLAG
jgi:hypothetical protein